MELKPKIQNRKMLAVLRLAAGMSMADVAKASRINQTTLRRWLAEPEVVDALEVERGCIMRAAFESLSAHVQKALSVYIAGLDHGLVSVRLKSAAGILDRIGKHLEVTQLSKRLAELEKTMTASGSRFIKRSM